MSANKEKEFQKLVQKYLDGTASKQEQDLLDRYYLLFADEPAYTSLLTDQQRAQLEQRMEKALFMRIKTPSKQVKLWPRFVAAAAIAIVVMTGGYLYYDKLILDRQSQIVNQNDIAPGKNGATLTLANGEQILINDALAGNIAEQSGVKISKNTEGLIVYTVSSEGGDSEGRGGYNTLSTSRSQQAQVRLPDGTLVFLNSESSLSYPTSFVKSPTRSVSLEGEGFFEVSKDKGHPFIVKTGGQDVQVLGTQFNINSYSGEGLIKTTLIEGSVKVSAAGKVSILKPDQQAIVSDKGINVENVEARFFVDWKEGFFMFNNDNLEDIMTRISRWYDIKVVYETPDLKTKTFIGTISKYEHISKVIQTLQGTGMASFKLNNGVLTISKNTSE